MVRTYFVKMTDIKNEELKKNLFNGRVKITTTIPYQDFLYVKNKFLKFSNLLENAISVHRTAFEEGISEQYHNYLKRKIEVIQERLTKQSIFISEKGLYEEFQKEIGEK